MEFCKYQQVLPNLQVIGVCESVLCEGGQQHKTHSGTVVCNYVMEIMYAFHNYSIWCHFLT